MPVQVILTAMGPLPINVTFTPPTTDPICIEINGSVYSDLAGQRIGISLYLDDVEQSGIAQIYANAAQTHMAVVPFFFPVRIADLKQHKLTLMTARFSHTQSDGTDFYTVVIHY